MRRGPRGQRKPYGGCGRTLLALARYAGGSVKDAIDLAFDYPAIFDQMLYDTVLTLKEEAANKAGGDGDWRKVGEGINEARDRLRAEREAAKARLSSNE